MHGLRGGRSAQFLPGGKQVFANGAFSDAELARGLRGCQAKRGQPQAFPLAD